VGLILPDRYRTTLRFFKIISFNFTGTFTQVARFRPSAAFDVDPLVASTSMAGFVELAALYTTYRVLSSKIRVEVVTTSVANPVMMVVVPTNTDPGGAVSTAYALSSRENPYSRSKMTGLSGAPPSVLASTMSTEKIYGSKAALFDDNFSALVTGNPNNNWYWAIIGLSSVFDPNLTWLQVTINVDCEFYDRSFLLN